MHACIDTQSILVRSPSRLLSLMRWLHVGNTSECDMTILPSTCPPSPVVHLLGLPSTCNA